MDQSAKWLPDAAGTPWQAFGEAMRSGFPVPGGYIAGPCTPEDEVRAAYERFIVLYKTHFVAVRGTTHAMLNVIGPDPLVHALRRLRGEASDQPVLVQRMIAAIWCGKANRHQNDLLIRANEGMVMLDPDTYIVDATTLRCSRRTIEPLQRKMIRHVDGSTKIVEREGPRTPMPEEYLAKISDLAMRAESDIGWAIDDVEKLWLTSTAASA
jgi:hypothetical protein